jgi:hypothetical protein
MAIKNLDLIYIMEAKLIETFFEMLNTIKLYHWKTTSYSEHKATDELHERLGVHIDKFVEVLLGKMVPKRISYKKNSTPIHDFSDKAGFINIVVNYRTLLVELSNILDNRKDTDLLNIRDEMVADVNQFLYLMSLS